ncbi:MAG: hypothetical protein AAF191_05405 [Verrucomicrobiota bacterium]
MKNLNVSFLALLILTPCLLSAQAPQPQAAPDPTSYYPYIQFMSNGEVLWNDRLTDPYNLGVQHRAVIISQEIYRTLIVETFQVQDEGGLIHRASQQLPLGEAVLKFETWASPTSFFVKIDGTKKLVSISRAGELTIADTSETGAPRAVRPE